MPHANAQPSNQKLARRIRELERQLSDSHPKRDLIREWPALAVSPKPKLTNPIRLPAQDVVVLSDIHAPMHDAEWMTRVLDLADAANIRTCVLNGDTLDLTVFGKWGHDPEETFEEELQSAENIFERLAAQFDDVVYLQGNHERRIYRTLNMQLRAERFVRLFTQAENVRVTYFEWVEMEALPGDYPWLFVHPKNTSVIPGRVPQQIGNVWSGHHIAAGHGHLRAQVRTVDGKRHAIDIGICGDPQRMGYVSISVSTRPRMEQGALIIRDGQPHLVNPLMDLERLAAQWRSEAA